MEIKKEGKPMVSITSIHKYLFMLIILSFGIFPSILTAKVFVATEIVSGQVISITQDNTIELDDGFLYYPVKKDIILSIQPDEYISIKYYINGNNERNYIEYSPGKNSLEATPLPEITTKPKKKL